MNLFNLMCPLLAYRSPSLTKSFVVKSQGRATEIDAKFLWFIFMLNMFFHGNLMEFLNAFCCLSLNYSKRNRTIRYFTPLEEVGSKYRWVSELPTLLFVACFPLHFKIKKLVAKYFKKYQGLLIVYEHYRLYPGH